jgi:hypothetical protein
MSYQLTITKKQVGKPAKSRTYVLNPVVCQQLELGKRVVVEIEDGDFIKATMKGKEDDKA